MVRVNLQQIGPAGGYNKIVKMPAVPRVGEDICLELGEATMQVRAVIWCPHHLHYDVQVRFR